MPDLKSPAGGAFLLTPSTADDPPSAFTPEQLPDDALQLAKAVEDFVRKEGAVANERLKAHEKGAMRGLLRKAGELGILGLAVPASYGGLDLPKSQITLLTEKTAIHPPFAISAGVHVGVATLPLLFFGTPDQRARYLPRLASGEWIGAFALSEANFGSDALGAQTRAALSTDGAHYVLNGAKMWITNGAFADLLTVFARVEGKGFTAFLVERTTPGVTVSREEHKLGLRGSSTVQILFDDAHVPVGNVLGAVGQGHRPALFTLNLGRLAIAATALGMCKENLDIAVRYAKQRVQFGRPIAEFGLIRHKLAEMAIRTFVLESMLYRTAGYLDARFEAIDAEAGDAQERYRAAAEEYAIECAIVKVFGTEALDFVVDEALQIHGGYGFSEEFAVAQAYRDARVFRIFEGTNEINRLTIVDQLFRRARSGRLSIWAEVDSPPRPAGAPPQEDGREADGQAGASAIGRDVAVTRAAVLGALRLARSQFGDALGDQQEVIALLADMVGAVYSTESAWLRLRQSDSASPTMCAAGLVHGYSARLLCGENFHAISGVGDDSSLAANWTEAMPPPRDVIALRRQVAAAVIDREGYPWQR